jgi:hypothetical protein
MHLIKEEGCPILKAIQVPIWIALYLTTTLKITHTRLHQQVDNLGMWRQPQI